MVAGGDWVCCGLIFVCDFGGWGLSGGGGGYGCGRWWLVVVSMGVGNGSGFVGSRRDEIENKI